LLYEHRELLERERLLIVGPNRIFLRYISQVLPSLGETASIQLTVEGLSGARFRVRGEDSADLARLKGDRRMGEVVRRAVLAGIVPPTEDVRISTGFGTLIIPAEQIAQQVELALSRRRPTNHGRSAVRDQILQLAWRIHSSKPTSDLSQQASFETEVRSSRQFKTAMDKSWPALSAAGVIRRLFASRPLLARASAGLLSEHERDFMIRRATPRVSEERWTRSDLALLDEAEALINGVPQTYGHVVVDEAQDLSAMELRMIARRSRRGSLTVLGDLAQATSPGAQSDWALTLEQLAAPKPRLEELTVGYRVPAPIIDFANRLLPDAAPSLRPSTSVRLRGQLPRLVTAEPGDWAAVVVSEVVDLAATWTSVGVVAPTTLLGEIGLGLAAAGVEYSDSQRTAELGEHVTLLCPAATKGLEFDAVLVAEPARIVREEPSGLRILYVALTRAVQRLTVVHAEALPTALAS
jgi:DNA helicase IV